MINDNDDVRGVFDEWNEAKINLELCGRRPRILQGQIWWTGVGRNVGVEINGKNERFSRPVIVYKKLSAHKFMAIPLTTKMHVGSWYVPFKHGNKEENAVVGDARVMSVKRLYRLIGRIDDADYERIRKGFMQLYE